MKKLKYLSFIILVLAFLMYSYNLVIGPVTPFLFGLPGILLILIDSIMQLFKGGNRIETLIFLFGVLGIIAYFTELEIGPLDKYDLISITWVPLVFINSVLKLFEKNKS